MIHLHTSCPESTSLFQSPQKCRESGAAPRRQDLQWGADQEFLQKLRLRDRRVRNREQGYFGAVGRPSFTFIRGPDGERYVPGVRLVSISHQFSTTCWRQLVKANEFVERR